MIAYSRSQVNTILFRVSDLVKIECKNVMLLENNICMLMIDAHQVDWEKIREPSKENKKAQTYSFEYSQQKLGGGNCLYFQLKFTNPTLSSASVTSPRFRQDQKGGESGSKS